MLRVRRGGGGDYEGIRRLIIDTAYRRGLGELAALGTKPLPRNWVFRIWLFMLRALSRPPMTQGRLRA